MYSLSLSIYIRYVHITLYWFIAILLLLHYYLLWFVEFTASLRCVALSATVFVQFDSRAIALDNLAYSPISKMATKTFSDCHVKVPSFPFHINSVCFASSFYKRWCHGGSERCSKWETDIVYGQDNIWIIVGPFSTILVRWNISFDNLLLNDGFIV